MPRSYLIVPGKLRHVNRCSSPESVTHEMSAKPHLAVDLLLHLVERSPRIPYAKVVHPIPAIDEPIRLSPLVGKPLPLQRIDQLRLVALTHLDRVVMAEVHVVLRVRWIELEPRG